ncbi:hypothetical protein GCK72_016639 [Caenorhabditis remanei]|uniref:CRE-NLP-33 protein n=1 Tax=Caenorhabditis remanei TaxID=31234 RepID=E3NGR8_CAERE|nr:hypothetical protein GCK72_016639 [Caenorhabditis remanei]EFO97198.1 CRE-NLP-33 protein [Caenorhabditis remanei]KAF1750093.1 hypothetical protein GCK72_016639 [Caenorhabditis remanei]
MISTTSLLLVVLFCAILAIVDAQWGYGGPYGGYGGGPYGGYGGGPWGGYGGGWRRRHWGGPWGGGYGGGPYGGWYGK